MKKNNRAKTTITLLIIFTAGVYIFVACGSGKQAVKEADYLPQDVQQSCTISQSDFNKWFQSGTASENGAVVPANSVAFPHNNNCDFYKWAEQMFLWITSPVDTTKYAKGNGNTVLESAVFYTVTPAKDSQRILLPHKPGKLLRAVGHIGQVSSHNTPFIFDKSGNRLLVKRHDTKFSMMNESGKSVEVKDVKTDKNGVHIFIDGAGKIIKQPKNLSMQDNLGDGTVTEVKLKSKTLYINSHNNVVETEQGQATGDALIGQNASLLYYITMVNDVYAQFLTASKSVPRQISGYQFPTTALERDSICAFAHKNGVTLSDSNALAIELKTSWVEDINLPDLTGYVTIDAIIPTYTKISEVLWVESGERTAKLALIGVHIVGSVAHHPEMVWATFEHEKNAPNAAYSYVDTSGAVKTVPADTGKNWLLSSNAAYPKPNISHINVDGKKLMARYDSVEHKSYDITPSNSLRIYPWGCDSAIAPNAEDKTTPAANSEVISINNAVRGMIVGSDIRKNYLLIGATWTANGAAPNGISYSDTSTYAGVAIGTSQLANSTMETYLGQDGFFPNGSCFACHSQTNSAGKPSLYPDETIDGLSHVFKEIQKLKEATEKKK